MYPQYIVACTGWEMVQNYWVCPDSVWGGWRKLQLWKSLRVCVICLFSQCVSQRNSWHVDLSVLAGIYCHWQPTYAELDAIHVVRILSPYFLEKSLLSMQPVLLINVLYLIFVITERGNVSTHYGATEALIIRGHSKAKKRVLLFLTVFIISGFFSEWWSVGLALS